MRFIPNIYNLIPEEWHGKTLKEIADELSPEDQCTPPPFPEEFTQGTIADDGFYDMVNKKGVVSDIFGLILRSIKLREKK